MPQIIQWFLMKIMIPLIVPQHSSGESKSSLRDAEPRDGKFKTHKRNSVTFAWRLCDGDTVLKTVYISIYFCK